MLMITHDLPFAWQMCERAVVLDEGRNRGRRQHAGSTFRCQLLAAHRLELPFGFDPGSLPA